MATKFRTQFMRNQWKVINADKILSENEVHGLIKAVEQYLDRPGSEPVREVVTDYNAFIDYVRNGAARGIFPATWPQYLQSARTGFLRYRSYRDTLPKGTPVPPVVPPPSATKPAPRPPFPNCCKTAWDRIRMTLKLSAVIDVVAITSDVHAFSTGAAKAKQSGKLRDPDAIASGMDLTNTTLGSLIPVAAKYADEHEVFHDEEDEYLRAWWAKMARSLRKYVK